MSDSKSPQDSRTLLSILTIFNNAVVWMVSTRPPTSKSSRPFNNPLVTVPKEPITIGIIVTFMFHSFFNSLARPRNLSLISHSISFILRVFHWSLSDSKSPQVSRTLLSILADLNNVVIWIFSTCPLISKSSSSFIDPLKIVPSAQITIGITVTFMFHGFFSSLARSWYLSFFALSFSLTLVIRNGKVHYSAGSLFIYIYIYMCVCVCVCVCIQQLCVDTGCSPEDLSEAMVDREEWREKIRDICADVSTG